jgi:regulator of protease activity HflC (stomatin/prohibitin superfamily)
MADPHSTHSIEQERHAAGGWLALVLIVLWFIAALAVFGSVGAATGEGGLSPAQVGLRIWAGLVMIGFGVFLCFGFFTLQPNEARVLILFGAYKGTVRRSGFHWANPLYARNRGNVPGAAPVPKRVKVGPLSLQDGTVTRPKLTTKLSLRAHNFNSETLKVNDKRGNPVEIAAVVVWRVVDTAEASFEVDNYENYVHVQSESALRNLATSYTYDTHDDATMSLRGHTTAVADHLKREIQDRLIRAGVEVIEARISHLAYAPEIAAAMLQRQQAGAIIAARQRIVEGAVGMVEMALEMLSKREIVHLDDERKAAMVSNLLVVLCGERSTQPVINAGTIYQ